MKVYNVASPYQGCYYVRQLLPQIANGWNGDYNSILELKGEETDAERDLKTRLKRAYESDIIVFHRCDQTVNLECMKAFKAIGKKVVYDNDDTTICPNTDIIKLINTRYEKNVIDAVSIADLVTASTPTLAKEYLKYNSNVKVLPNCVAPNHFPKKNVNNTDKVRIGFVGSVAYKDDAGNIRPIIEWLCSLPNVQVVMYSFEKDKNKRAKLEILNGDYEFWEGLNIEWQNHTPMKDYYETLNNLRLDIMVAPRADNYFNRCKSNLKYLEASMLEIAFIGQSFTTKDSPYDKDIIDGENGFLAENNTQFKEKLEKLINNTTLRKQVAKNAKEYVLKHYNIYDNAWKWEKSYKQLIN